MLCLLFLAGCITAAKFGQNSANKNNTNPNQIQLESIDLKVNAETIDLQLKGNGKMKYSAVKQDFPLGVMVYLHDAVIADKFIQPSASKVRGISSLSASYVDSTKKTVVVKILLSENLNYEVKEKADPLTLVFYKKGGAISSGKGTSSDTSAIEETQLFEESEPSQIRGTSEKLSSISPPSSGAIRADGKGSVSQPVITGKRAVVTGIDFHSGDEGESSIVIKTSNPVKYEMQRDAAKNELRLNLYNTDIPEYHQRQLITTYFKSAVDKIIPVDRSGKESASKIHIVMREKVPYHILQENNRLTLFLEPSSVKPIKLEEPGLSIADGSNSGTATLSGANKLTSTQGQLPTAETKLSNDNGKLSQPSINLQSTAPDESKPEDLEANQALTTQEKSTDQTSESLFDQTPVYTGEAISLDFYETDIKNVFRILQTVSGENFAVDKDVTGAVTLTLEKPAPWDEILDLILKMNGLGKIKEGSIVRIATTATIKREADEKAATLAAKIAELELKKAQEPMFTEYIPINYSSAETDIKPHLEKLLTPSRGAAGGVAAAGSGGSGDGTTTSGGGGSVSVDKRTNMIILTDTKKKIAEMKQLIYTLDKVTPQILISARIVEVTKDFSHALGVDWGLTDSINTPSIYRDDIGGVYGFDIAMNHPVAADASIGYTFSRLAGTPLLLDARLTASEITNDLKVISSPKVLTLDNKEATIKQGVEYPYEKAATEAGGNPTTEFKNVDLALTVTPQVTPDKRIGMKIDIKKMEIAGLTSKGEPYISTSSANTELLVNDGNTIVIGGIVKSTVSEGSNAFPLLSKIPYLGQIFRSDTSKDNKSELLIFITPTIVQLDQKANKL